MKKILIVFAVLFMASTVSVSAQEDKAKAKAEAKAKNKKKDKADKDALNAAKAAAFIKEDEE